MIETERLNLREMIPSDDKALFEMDSDPEVHKFLGNKPVTDIEECRKTIDALRKQYLDNGIGRWAMIEKSSGHFAGWTGIKFFRDSVNNHVNFYEVGYRLNRAYWGQGYATESTLASLKYAFEELKTNEVFGITHIENFKSIHVLKKCGLSLIETFVWKEWNDLTCNWLRISKDEWEDRSRIHANQ